MEIAAMMTTVDTRTWGPNTPHAICDVVCGWWCRIVN